MGPRHPGEHAPRSKGTIGIAVMLVLCGLVCGCTAITNPVADGIPVRLLPDEVIGPARTCWQTIPLSTLRQSEPDVYRLAAGDVLGVFIDGFVGAVTVPVNVAPLLQLPTQNRLPPSAGYPIKVQQDGTIGLPAVPKLAVAGMTVGEAREAIRDLYVKKELIRPENERILVTLLHPREVEVLVFRQEATSLFYGPDGPFPSSKRNAGFLVDLPAYKNDVLHALARTGGLPDQDAYNEIIIYRDCFHNHHQREDMLRQLEQARPGEPLPLLPGAPVGETIRIPLRLPAGAPLPFRHEDAILRSGDVVFLEARDEQAFFTGGLLPPGKWQLPRDQDLDVLEAITRVRGPLYNGAFGGSSLAGNIVVPGLGSPSPSLLIVLRRLPGKGQIPITVDLRAAMRHPEERLIVRPGDLLVLQEKPVEAFTRVFTQTILNVDLFLIPFKGPNGFGVVDIAGPDRLTTPRVGTLFQTITP
jgi:protein involved in polysaccharide export with SLBB domain